jgi:peptidoglycan/xylan/chitin deacetylase (PgdA/CDA1 family)
LRVPGLKTLNQCAWMLRGRLFGGGIILGYHRVAHDPDDPWGLCVDPRTFESHIEILRRDFCPVPLGQVTEPRVGTLPVVITFDDGYADVWTDAVPILERHEVPATVFVVPAATSGSFWWDRLRALLETPERLPAELDLDAGGLRMRWTREQGHPALRDMLHRSLRTIGSEALEEALAGIATWSGTGEISGRPPVAVLTDEQLDGLGRHPLLEVGSHTMSHADLSVLGPEALDQEIRGSRLWLQERLGEEVESFSYPHGGLRPEVRRLVEDSGYRRACSSSSGLVQRRTDPYHLPRLWPPSEPEGDFRRWIHRWTGR